MISDEQSQEKFAVKNRNTKERMGNLTGVVCFRYIYIYIYIYI